MTPRYKNEKRKQLMEETRARLLTAAIEEFAHEGFDGASISRITQAADVATGTIYNYFPSKNELMLAVLSGIGNEHCLFIAEQIRQEANISLRVERLFEAGFDFLKKDPLKARVLFSMMMGSDATFRFHLNNTYQPMFQLISDDILIPGMQQGIFRPLDPINTTLMIMTFYLGVGSVADENGITPLDLKEVAAFVLRALGANTPQVPPVDSL
jgi:AcrR family transcriptional regulator